MMTKILAFIGTLVLAWATLASGYWAIDVSSKQPLIPELGLHRETSAPAPDKPASAPSRRARAEVFYSATIERPLFSPTRRPRVPESEVRVIDEKPEVVPVIEKTAPPHPEVDLLGVMGGAVQSRALVANAGGDPVWLTEGTQISGWTVSRIGPDWLELADGPETMRIEMYQQ